jgi:hypothetical protein
MPVVLSQRTWQGDPKYLDREGVIYHYPRQYRGRIGDFDRFIYYRPAAGASQAEASTYVGHGILGASFEDFAHANHWYAPIAWYEPFHRPVPLREAGNFLETESATGPQFQSAARPIRETAYFRILAYGGISAGREFSAPTTTETAVTVGYAAPLAQMPKDVLRVADRIPEGTGYVPSGKALPSVYESAALQERARKDHNETLELIRRKVDLFVRCAERRMLIEAKSLTDVRQSVDRMRYGMGQLFDYRVRYRAEIQDAEPVLAFGALPDRATNWIGSILQENGVAFVGRLGAKLIALNERAEGLPISTPGA